MLSERPLVSGETGIVHVPIARAAAMLHTALKWRTFTIHRLAKAGEHPCTHGFDHHPIVPRGHVAIRRSAGEVGRGTAHGGTSRPSVRRACLRFVTECPGPAWGPECFRYAGRSVGVGRFCLGDPGAARRAAAAGVAERVAVVRMVVYRYEVDRGADVLGLQFLD